VRPACARSRSRVAPASRNSSCSCKKRVSCPDCLPAKAHRVTKVQRKVVLRSNKDEDEVKTMTGVHTEGDDRPELLTLHVREEAEYFDCLALCLLLRLGEYWFHISRYVYDPNRPLAPILRQCQCSLMYDVYLTCIDDDEQVLHLLRVQVERGKIPGIQSRIRIESVFFEQSTMNNGKAKEWKQKLNKKINIKQKSNVNKINGTTIINTI
jgi:hypothetical protein